ncbi:MAG: 30S ribosomal protein S2 [bacterium]|nr:MAG: 30S ribosomal protein S2 [bacterium]
MMNVSLQDLLMAGTHFGHLTRRWNPKMKKFIFMEKNGIYIIDIKKTLAMLEHACEEIANIVRSGERILFVGTKKQAKDIIRIEAERCGQFYVNERWLGGTLTNFITVKKSIKRLKNLDKMATDGTYEKLTKKEILYIERDKEKLEKVLGGIKEMSKLPGAIYVVDVKKESIAVHEADRLNIPIIGLIDTNSDPDLIDFPIPGNDDAFKSINLITRSIADAIIEAQQGQVIEEVEEELIEEKKAVEMEEIA